MADVTCDGQSSREINRRIKELIASGEREIVVRGPGARHNLGVAILEPAHITLDGSVGYYCAGLCDGPTVEIHGSAGWGLAESMLSGTVIVNGNVGNGAGASLRGGTVVVRGDAAARAGVSMKGGLLLIAGDCGYMAGFMAQKGTLIVCGDAGEAFADSMYACVCFVGGRAEQLGNDTVVERPTAEDVDMLENTLSRYLPDQHQSRGPVREFKKIIAGRKLWNFDHREWDTWREAL